MTSDVTPEPIRAFLTGQPTPREFRRISLTAQMRRTLTDLMQPTCLPQFTRAYREIKARELALSALSELQGERRVYCAPPAESQPAGPPALTAEQLLRATKWLHENLCEEHDLRDLAASRGGHP